MNRFAELLDRLAYEPGRNNKLRLITAYFRETPDPDRGYALAAITGALSFKHAKPGLIRDLIAERTDPVLFGLSYDYVGDLSETVALMWPKTAPGAGHNNPPPPSLTEVVTTLRTLGKTELPRQLSQWLDELDETGRWALLKLVTGALRVGVSARLAKTAVAALGSREPDEIEVLWPTLVPPYADLFAWVEGRTDMPVIADPAPFRPLRSAWDFALFPNIGKWCVDRRPNPEPSACGYHCCVRAPREHNAVGILLWLFRGAGWSIQRRCPNRGLPGRAMSYRKARAPF